MVHRTEFKRLSKRARELLASGETKYVDYKVNLGGLHADDLVAFANSSHGGAILVGVRDAKNEAGQQIGEPIGCPIGDGEKLQIIQKALSCHPPLQVELFVENLSDKPFYRVEVPSGKQKPYSTSGGTYKIREDGGNCALYPEQLLGILLHREGEEFRTRFAQATEGLSSKMGEALQLVEMLQSAIGNRLEDISGSVDWAESSASDTIDLTRRLLADVAELSRESESTQVRLKALLSHLDAAGPVKEEQKTQVLEELLEKLREDDQLLELASDGRAFAGRAPLGELDEDDVLAVVSEAARIVRRERGTEDGVPPADAGS